MPIFCKNTSILLKTYHFRVHILSKKRPHSHKHGAWCHLHRIFHEKTMLSCPCLAKNASILSNYTILGAKKVHMIPFFPIFHEKITALMPVFCKKTSILSKKLCPQVIFWFNFFMKTPCCHAHIWCKKRQFCQNNIKWIMGQKKS